MILFATLWGYVFGEINTLVYSETKPDGIKLSGFFIFKKEKGVDAIKFESINTVIIIWHYTKERNIKMENKITTYYSPTQILERASKNMVLLESQKDFREKFASLLSMHLAKVQTLESGEYSFNQLPSNSCFIVSPTGTGKSYLLKSLTIASDMNCHFIDSTQLTQAGFKGCNLTEILGQIYVDNNDFFNSANVLVFDEFDKVFFNAVNQYVNATNPQRDLLKLFEGSDYTIMINRETNKTVNLDKTLIILSGACSELSQIMRRKYMPKTSLGFGSSESSSKELTANELVKKAEISDLIEYGMLRELGSRINSVLHIGCLTKYDYEKLVQDNSRVSAINQYRSLLKVRGCSLDITETAVSKISDIAVERNVGARTVSAVVSEQLSSAYGYLDNHQEYNKVILDTDDKNEFVLHYQKGKRKTFSTFNKTEKSYRKNYIFTELSSENNLNRFCCDICNVAGVDNLTHEIILYSFLQVTCRYLAYNLCSAERRIDNLLKLASSTEKQNDESRSPFEIICCDFLDKEKNNKNEYIKIFEFFFERFKENYTPNTRDMLVKAISTASKNLSLTVKNDK